MENCIAEVKWCDEEFNRIQLFLEGSWENDESDPCQYQCRDGHLWKVFQINHDRNRGCGSFLPKSGATSPRHCDESTAHDGLVIGRRIVSAEEKRHAQSW